MSDRSHVTLAVCPICHEDTGAILLDRKMRDVFERRTITPSPCEACKEKYLSVGVLLFVPDNGSVAVIKDEAFTRIFNRELPKDKIAFCDYEVLERLGAYSQEESNEKPNE